MNASWADSWRSFLRDLREGELTLLMLALILAVAAMTSLRFFTNGVELRMRHEAARLLAADLVVRSSRPLPTAFFNVARESRLDNVQTLEFSSVLLHGNTFQLASVKAVGTGYPLRGEMRIRTDGQEFTARQEPRPGEAWLDRRLLALLDLHIGDTVTLGDLALRVTAELTQEPGQGAFSGIAPRALINLSDVPATGVVQPGSRLTYQLLLRGSPSQLDAYARRMKPRLGTGMRLLDAREGRPEIGTPLLRSQSYFSLATIVAVVLAGLAIVTASRRFAERRYDEQALLRCLGASRHEALRRFISEIFWLWLIAVILGALLGLATAELLSAVLAGLLPVEAPLYSVLRPLLTAVLTASLTLLGFALPAFISLGSITPLRVLRRELPALTWSGTAVTSGALVAIMVLLTVETGEAQLAFIVIAGGGLGAVALWWLLARLLQALRRHMTASGIASLVRAPRESSLQILGLALGLTALLLVVSLRGELLSAWKGKIPRDAPNQFALNIAADERTAFSAFLAGHGIAVPSTPYSIVRGRLVAINGKKIREADTARPSSRHDESLERELNLTSRAQLPEGNTLMQGKWWPDNAGTQAAGVPVSVSVEEKLATRLDLHVGDNLRFSLAEGNIDAVVTSMRKVDWDSFRPNFYFIFPPGTLDRFPASYLTSFHVSALQRDVLPALVKAFPTVILIDVAATMSEVQRLLDQIARAIELVLSFVLAAALLVISGQVVAGLDARRFEAALLRVTGISQRALMWRLSAEFLFTGLSPACWQRCSTRPWQRRSTIMCSISLRSCTRPFGGKPPSRAPSWRCFPACLA
ncbi:MAG TPA: ABC transporter permease [Moraxellaceae bacterium]|nr:ABC transporter permease [Moraxellaceae bacterium]